MAKWRLKWDISVGREEGLSLSAGSPRRGGGRRWVARKKNSRSQAECCFLGVGRWAGCEVGGKRHKLWRYDTTEVEISRRRGTGIPTYFSSFKRRDGKSNEVATGIYFPGEKSDGCCRVRPFHSLISFFSLPFPFPFPGAACLLAGDFLFLLGTAFDKDSLSVGDYWQRALNTAFEISN